MHAQIREIVHKRPWLTAANLQVALFTLKKMELMREKKMRERVLALKPDGLKSVPETHRGQGLF